MSRLFETLQQYEMASSDVPSLLTIEGQELFGVLKTWAVEDRKAPDCLQRPSMIGGELVMWFSQDLMEELAALLVDGYEFSPWHGIEAGGVFFGTTETDGIHILCYRPITSDHQHGPSFKLSKRDLDDLTQLLADANEDDRLKGLVPVGWFHSVCNRALTYDENDTAVHDHFFTEPWQVAMVLKGSECGPVTIGLSFRQDKHSLPIQPERLYTLGDLRSRSTTLQAEVAVPVQLGFSR